jgi:hypothetical protein
LRVLRTKIEDNDCLSGHASSVAGGGGECKDGKGHFLMEGAEPSGPWTWACDQSGFGHGLSFLLLRPRFRTEEIHFDLREQCAQGWPCPSWDFVENLGKLWLGKLWLSQRFCAQKAITEILRQDFSPWPKKGRWTEGLSYLLWRIQKPFPASEHTMPLAALIEIDQGESRQMSVMILQNAAIAHLGITEDTLQDAERPLHFRSNSRLRAFSEYI